MLFALLKEWCRFLPPSFPTRRVFLFLSPRSRRFGRPISRQRRQRSRRSQIPIEALVRRGDFIHILPLNDDGIENRVERLSIFHSASPRIFGRVLLRRRGKQHQRQKPPIRYFAFVADFGGKCGRVGDF